MRTFLVQLLREVRSIFYTPVAYVVMAMFVALMGFNFQGQISALNQQPTEVTILEVTFLNVIFIFVFAFTTSLITMRSFSEEFRMGTIEMLTTAPVKDWHVVLAKFFGVVIFYIVLFAPTAGFFVIFHYVSGGAMMAKSMGAFCSTYLLLILIGMLFISIGIFASSLVRDQVNAAVISITVSIVYLWLPLMMSQMLNSTDPRVRQIAEFVSPIWHLSDYSKGLVDSRRIVWYLSTTAVFVILTHHVFHSRKLKS